MWIDKIFKFYLKIQKYFKHVKLQIIYSFTNIFIFILNLIYN